MDLLNGRLITRSEEIRRDRAAKEVEDDFYRLKAQGSATDKWEYLLSLAALAQAASLEFAANQGGGGGGDGAATSGDSGTGPAGDAGTGVGGDTGGTGDGGAGSGGGEGPGNAGGDP